MNKENKKYLIISIISVLVILIGVTAAYWIAKIKGDGSQITVTVDTLKIKFNDTQEIIDGEIYLNWQTEKTFSVENESDQDYTYNINIEDLLNTLVTDTLEYRITSDTGFNMEEFKKVNKCPGPEKCIQTIGESVTIGPNAIQTYKIEFRYLNNEFLDQTEDQTKTFSGKLSITRGHKPTLADFFEEKYPKVTKRENGTFGTTISDANVYYEDDKYTEDGNFEKTFENATKLVAYLVKEYNLKLGNIKTHHDFSGKDCPHKILKNNRMEEFIKKVKKY